MIEINGRTAFFLVLLSRAALVRAYLPRRYKYRRVEAWATVTFGYCSVYEACRCAWCLSRTFQKLYCLTIENKRDYSIFNLNVDLQIVADWRIPRTCTEYWIPLLFWPAARKISHLHSLSFKVCIYYAYTKYVNLSRVEI